MPISVIMKYLGSANAAKQLEMLLAIHCAPVLYGIKLSNLVCLTQKQSVILCHNVNAAGISIWFLEYNGDKNQVLLYRKPEMQRLLEKSEIQEILYQFGYKEFQVISVLLRLSEQLKRYQAGIREFPHEIGILLGYPISDVMEFLKHQGKNYACCGYWKVYENVEQAKKLFKTYDQVREAAITQVLNGREWICERQ